MTASAKEVISDAIHLPSARKCDEYADAILAALDSAGYVVVPREPTEAADVIDALVAALEKTTDWIISCDASTWDMHMIEEADAALARARRK